MGSSIGIKIANGEFYPIIEENSFTKKRLILTTVHDNQPSVQIDLYRSAVNAMADAQYIGSLVVENIKSKSKGDPSIELVMSSGSNGEIIADAIDLDRGSDGEHCVLTVSLKSLDETSRDMNLPDFELENNELPPSGLYQQANKVRQKKRKPKIWVFILIGLAMILALLGVWLFLLDGLNKLISARQPENPIVMQVVEPARQPDPVPEPVSEPDPPPVISASQQPSGENIPEQTEPGVRVRPPAPVSSYNVPAVIPREGVEYRIRWGDTLWDISEAFYRNPLLYPRIARHNNIRNPDLIYSDRTLRIPPRN